MVHNFTFNRDFNHLYFKFLGFKYSYYVVYFFAKIKISCIQNISNNFIGTYSKF